MNEDSEVVRDIEAAYCVSKSPRQSVGDYRNVISFHGLIRRNL